MKKPFVLTMASAAIFLMTSCMTVGTKDVLPIGPNLYMVGGPGEFTDFSGSVVKARLYKTAIMFCTDKGLVMLSVRSTSSDSGYAKFATAEIQFRCLTPNDPRLASQNDVAAPPPKALSGTAFRIANGQFVTNHHVINGCSKLSIQGNSGAKVIASDANNDLALVSIANDTGQIASIRTTRIQLNESISTAGFPLTWAFTGIAITSGTVSRLSGYRGDTGEVQISAPVQPGNSGGPLLDTAGNVIGVVSSGLNGLNVAGATGHIPQNVNMAVAGNVLRGFLDSKGVNYKEVGNEPEITGVQLAARASAFTLLIECQ